MANLITLLRLFLLFQLVGMAYWAPPSWQLINAPLVLFIIALDAVDGYVARLRGETSVFGSMFDIAVDRAVENVLWIVLGNIGLIPIWVAIVFVVRGALVDTVRYAMASSGSTPFGTMRSSVGKALVSGRFARGLYGTIKAITFAWVLLLQPVEVLAPSWWAAWQPLCAAVTHSLIAISVALCLARGLPVVIEFLNDQRVFRPRSASAGSS
ncbi:MAG: CDP-alcohol phosphatidyltransferase family protein [Rhodospirillales bacterium]|nr:CDP-alcohol phosphatidyltransferase family protein [Rhodospirillales bacterium]